MISATSLGLVFAAISTGWSQPILGLMQTLSPLFMKFSIPPISSIALRNIASGSPPITATRSYLAVALLVWKDCESMLMASASFIVVMAAPVRATERKNFRRSIIFNFFDFSVFISDNLKWSVLNTLLSQHFIRSEEHTSESSHVR